MFVLLYHESISPWKAVAAIGIAAGLVLAGVSYSKYLKNKNNKITPDSLQKWTRIGRIKKLIIYPVKSCPGIEVESAKVGQLGLQGDNLEFLRDRIFLIVDSKGNFQTLRQFPTLTLIRVNVTEIGVEFTAPGYDTLILTNDLLKSGQLKLRPCRIFTDRLKSVTDCGDEVGIWLDKYLGQTGLRLVYHQSSVTHRNREIKSIDMPYLTHKDFGSFQDETSYMIMTEESIQHFNENLLKPLTYTRFRPSILMDEVAEPLAEENWTYIRISDKESGPILKTAILCVRCKVTTVDTETGKFEKDGEPLISGLKVQRSLKNDELAKLAKLKPILGVHFGLFDGEGKIIKVGDPVYAALK